MRSSLRAVPFSHSYVIEACAIKSLYRLVNLLENAFLFLWLGDKRLMIYNAKLVDQYHPFFRYIENHRITDDLYIRNGHVFGACGLFLIEYLLKKQTVFLPLQYSE